MNVLQKGNFCLHARTHAIINCTTIWQECLLQYIQVFLEDTFWSDPFILFLLTVKSIQMNLMCIKID